MTQDVAERPPRVLVVDDDAALLRMLRLSFSYAGCEVVTAIDGQDAIEKVDSGAHFDVVVLDLQMPRMDGRTFHREFRSRGREEPVVILSAYGAMEAKRELRAAAALSKPFDPEELVRTVSDLASE